MVRFAKTFGCTVAVGLSMATAGCGNLFGPGEPERSIVGAYRGQWTFGVYDPGTIVPGGDPPDARSRGWIHCPADFQVIAQDGRDIRGTFELRPQPRMSCDSSQPGFCSENLSAKLCRQVSGTFKGEAFSTGAPKPQTILFKFRMEVDQTTDYLALGRFLGCTVSGGDALFTGGVYQDEEATARGQATVDCGGDAGLGRVDLVIALRAGRVSVER